MLEASQQLMTTVCQSACVLQNEVAYEYFTDRFSVTAQRPYNKASLPKHAHWKTILTTLALWMIALQVARQKIPD